MKEKKTDISLLTRRCFLQSAACALALPAAPAFATTMRRPAIPSARILASANNLNTNKFCAAFNESVGLIGEDLADALQDTIALLQTQPPTFLAGLTREIDHLLIEQIAIEHRFRRVFYGRHLCDENGLKHSLAGPDSAVMNLADALRLSTDEWSSTLADHLGTLMTGRRTESMNAVTVSGNCTARAPERLVSWVLYRSGAHA